VRREGKRRVSRERTTSRAGRKRRANAYHRNARWHPASSQVCAPNEASNPRAPPAHLHTWRVRSARRPLAGDVSDDRASKRPHEDGQARRPLSGDLSDDRARNACMRWPSSAVSEVGPLAGDVSEARSSNRGRSAYLPSKLFAASLPSSAPRAFAARRQAATAPAKSRASSAARPAAVVPPGLVTLRRSSLGGS